jgi:hypothetical protein
MAIKPSEISLEDSKLHASLMARDLARCFNELPGTSQSQASVTILVDMEALSDTSPVNLRCHAQEQLFNRSAEKVKEFYGFMKLPDLQRQEETREWYRNCIKEADEELQNSRFPVDSLDFCGLTKRIMAAEDVTFIEGASFKLLRCLVDEPGVAAKINCVVQAVSLRIA